MATRRKAGTPAVSSRPRAIDFFVAGVPQPGGSKRLVRAGGRADGRAILIDDCRRNKSWREVVAAAAWETMIGSPLSGPLEVMFLFVVPRPRGHYGTGRNADRVRESAPDFPSVKPDVLKLARAAEDSLSGICYIDDAQIVREHIAKVYGDDPGVRVVIRSLEGLSGTAADPWARFTIEGERVG